MNLAASVSTVLLACAISLGGCSPAATHRPCKLRSAAPDLPADEAARQLPRRLQAPVLLDVRGYFEPSHRSQSRPLMVGEVLASGDRVAFELRLDQPAYVYVVEFFDDGADVVYPRRGHERFCPFVETRIPQDERYWLQLDSTEGMEHLYIVASLEPLAHPPAAVRQILGGRVQRSAGSAGADEPWREPPASTVGRDLRPSCEQQPQIGRFGPHPGYRPSFGSGVIHFPIVHEQ